MFIFTKKREGAKMELKIGEKVQEKKSGEIFEIWTLHISRINSYVVLLDESINECKYEFEEFLKLFEEVD